MIHLLISVAFMAANEPSPFDAYRANRRGISAEVSFEFEQGDLRVRAQDAWTRSAIQFAPNPQLKILGEWASDGDAEYFHYGSASDAIARACSVGDQTPRVSGLRKPKLFYSRTMEALTDGRTFAHHSFDPVWHPDKSESSYRTISVQEIGRDLPREMVRRGSSPFRFLPGPDLDRWITDEFIGRTAQSFDGTVGGHAVEFEVRRRETRGGGYELLEIGYDPSIGYLPRFVRIMTVGSSLSAYVHDVYLLDAWRSPGGSFVPSEWYTDSFEISSLRKQFPNYETGMPMRPALTGGAHFRLASRHALERPIALRELDRVEAIGSAGGIVEFRPTGRPLDLNRLRATLGSRLSNPVLQVGANVDRDELKEPLDEAHRPWTAVFGACALVCAALLFARHRRRAAISVVFVALNAGCGERESMPLLTLTPRQHAVLRRVSGAEYSWDLLIKNAGHRAVTIIKIDGGCSCRKFDSRQLPLRLSSGATGTITVTMAASKKSGPQTMRLTLETDRGSIMGDTTIVVLSSLA